MAHIHAAKERYESDTAVGCKEVIKLVFGSLDHIQRLVDAFYQVVQTQFGQAGSLLDEIDFEVTFMTRSYVDNEITIYASQNRDHREPRSLLLRSKDKDLYSKTVIAEVYREVRPEMHIIDDTSNGSYHAVYSGQLERIKSSIVYPITSDRSELLGTLVLHCNKKKFFKQADGKFWRKMFEPYAKRIAFEKLKLDFLLVLDLTVVAQVNVYALKPAR